MPALRRQPVALNGRGQPKSADALASCPAIEHLRLATATQPGRTGKLSVTAAGR